MAEYIVVEKYENDSFPCRVTKWKALEAALLYGRIQHEQNIKNGITVDVKTAGEIIFTFTGTRPYFPVYTIFAAAKADYEADPDNCEWDVKEGYDTEIEALTAVSKMNEQQGSFIYKITLEPMVY